MQDFLHYVFTVTKCYIFDNDYNPSGNGICDDRANIRHCNFDGGDCCLPIVDIDYCTICQCHKLPRHCPNETFINDGICQEAMNNELCRFDGNDCIATQTEPSFCGFPCLYHIGDGQCDDFCNFEACHYDLGDCCNKTTGLIGCELCECKVQLPPCPGIAFVADNVCNLANMKAECFFDGGDCEQ